LVTMPTLLEEMLLDKSQMAEIELPYNFFRFELNCVDLNPSSNPHWVLLAYITL